MILLIDNYDSFAYNVYQWIGAEEQNIQVARNDEITIDEIKQLKPQAIILSPGPKRPKDAGICIELVQKFYQQIPILGICLGHQSIAEAFGGKVGYAKELMHGKQDTIYVLKEDPIFKKMGDEFPAARYHSLSVDEHLSDDLIELAKTKDDEVMAIKHKVYPVYGLQFHPESVMTPNGPQIMKIFISIIGGK